MRKLFLVSMMVLATAACREEVKASPDVQVQCAGDTVCLAKDVSADTTEDVAPAADASEVTASK